nr:MAG TPA: crossover junction endodeoxyribonuclease [Caudoviricetes sp.]
MSKQIVIKLDVPSQAVSALSGNRRGSTRSYRQTAAVSRLREQAYYLARSLKNSGTTISHPTHCVAWLSFPTTRRRDSANFQGAIKPIIDGIVSAGLLPDDDITHLVGPDVRIDPSVRAAPGVVHVELKFTPLTPAVH